MTSPAKEHTMDLPQTPLVLIALAKDATMGIRPAIRLIRHLGIRAGYSPRPGGWIYDQDGTTVGHGWQAFAGQVVVRRAVADRILAAVEAELAEAEADRQAEKEALELAEKAAPELAARLATGSVEEVLDRGPVVELKVPTPGTPLQRAAQLHAYAHVGTVAGVGEVYVAPIGTPEPGPEDLADLALALAEEDLEHVDPDGGWPEPATPPAHTLDVVTIHRGDRLYEVLKVERDGGYDMIRHQHVDHSMALVAPCDPEDHRDPQWVSLDLLHVRPPLGSFWTQEVTRRVRQTREVFRVGERLAKVRTVLVDSARLPVPTLAEVPFGPEPVATLRAGEAVVVDGRTFRVMDPEGTGELRLEPASWRARILS